MMITFGRTGADVAAEIEMSRQNWTGSFLIVEGPSDYRFWCSRKHDTCQPIIAEGREKVAGAISILNSRNFEGALGVVDDDFDSLAGSHSFLENLVTTDPRDIEGLLVRSGALEKVMAEIGDVGKVQALLDREQASLREILLRNAKIFGQIHWVNHLSGAPVCLRALRPMRFCNVATWTYDEGSILSEAVTLGVDDSIDELRKKLALLPEADSWFLCRGHDLIDILVGGLLSAIGGGVQSGRERVEGLLRAGYENGEFDKTTLFSKIRQWERENQPYLVLNNKFERAAE